MTRQEVSPRLRTYARALRREQTPHERRLWGLLRDRRFVDFKFRRQAPIGPYVVDFVCYDALLVVELDGSQHAEDIAYDSRRDADLKRRGFRILRFWNSELNKNRRGVIEMIWLALHGELPDAE